MIRLGVIGHSGYAELPGVIRTLCELAPSLDLELHLEEPLREVTGLGERLEDPTRMDAVLTLGGDGTLLRAARFLQGRPVPILGVNLGRLGFLTCCTMDEMATAVSRLATGDYLIEHRMQIAASVRDPAGAERGHWLALNDVVLHKGGFARVVPLTIEANGELVASYAADGVVLSTPTGSTAYSLSAGGPVVFPTLETLLVTPVSAHTLAIRSLMLPWAAEIVVRADGATEELMITIDGQAGTSFQAGETLVVRSAQRGVQIVRFPGQSFFATLRRKLGWGGLAERDRT